jgi:hypothetical protein
MECRELQERLSDLQDGTLPGAVVEAMSSHLRACRQCAEVSRTLEAVRDQLRDLPPLPAPPELLQRVCEMVARECAPAAPPAPSTGFLSRLKIPLQAAAVILLFASVYWYQAERTPPVVPKAAVSAAGVASSAPPAVHRRAARALPRTAPPGGTEGFAALEQGMRREGVSTLPPDTPDPKVRVWSRADLPAVPALRAGTDAERIVPGFPTADEMRRQVAYTEAHKVFLEVAPEDRDAAEKRVAESARNLGGSVEGADRAGQEGVVALHVLLPEHAEPAFLDALTRIGKIPPGGAPAAASPRPGHETGLVAYTVNLRVR